LINAIYRHARDTPEKIAVINSGRETSYQRFANAIEAVRNSLQTESLPDSGVIVIINSNLYHDWVLMLALRSLGLTPVEQSRL
jgi:non-ribosomal peptide synthetase component E (peptide arylation enzyme)